MDKMDRTPSKSSMDKMDRTPGKSNELERKTLTFSWKENRKGTLIPDPINDNLDIWHTLIYDIPD